MSESKGEACHYQCHDESDWQPRHGLELWQSGHRADSSTEAAQPPRESRPGRCLSKRQNSTNYQLRSEHSSPIDAFVECWCGAELSKVTIPRQDTSDNASLRSIRPARGKSKRGEISEFSAKSAIRLGRQLAMVQKCYDADFVTITYPGEWFPDAEDKDIYWAHFKAFRMRFLRAFPNAAAFWKMEFQQRGAVHFHLIVLGDTGLHYDERRRWLRENWCGIVEKAHVLSDDARDDFRHVTGHQKSWEPLRCAHAKRLYMRKYGCKRDQTLHGKKVGRYWGHINRKLLFEKFILTPESVPLEPEHAKRIRRTARKLIESKRRAARWRRVEDHGWKMGFRLSRLEMQLANRNPRMNLARRHVVKHFSQRRCGWDLAYPWHGSIHVECDADQFWRMVEWTVGAHSPD